jgi:hypothetical protein
MSTASEPAPAAIADALAVLGLGSGAAWVEIRQAYRDQVRVSHPDVEASDRDRATGRTAALNVAFATLSAATAGGTRPLPDPEPAAPPPTLPAPAPVTLRAGPGDVFVQLLDAAHEIGEVGYMDPEAGLIQILLGAGPAASQLLIAVDQDCDPPTASFTLDSPGGEEPPPIQSVVDDLAALLRP